MLSERGTSILTKLENCGLLGKYNQFTMERDEPNSYNLLPQSHVGGYSPRAVSRMGCGSTALEVPASVPRALMERGYGRSGVVCGAVSAENPGEA